MVQINQNIIGVDSAIFMHPKTWIASGHVEAFNDLLIDSFTNACIPTASEKFDEVN